MDGDGDNDLIIGMRQGYVTYYERLEDGSLGSPDTIFAIPEGSNSNPYVTDWDNDGDMDLVVAGIIKTFDKVCPVYLFENVGENQFTIDTSSQNFKIIDAPLLDSIERYRTVAVEDLDNDGLNDLIIGINKLNPDNSNSYIKVRWYKNMGSKENPSYPDFEYLTFDDLDSVDDNTNNLRLPYITVSDYNEDGIMDMLFGTSKHRTGVPKDQLIIYYGNRSVVSNQKTNYTSKLNVTPFIQYSNGKLIFTKKFEKGTKLFVLDIKGKVVYHDSDVSNKNELDISKHISQGVYFIKLQLINSVLFDKVSIIK